MIRALFSLIFTTGLIVALNSKIGPMPPLGKFMDPFHGFWANARQVDDMPGQITMPGLEAEVSVLYDDMLVPHIFATSDYDLYAATGYVHASNRLWQMEIQTHAAAGRLSEIAGEVTLDMDRGQRRKGMVFGAENFIAHLDDTSLLILNAYADGVNAFIEHLDYEQLPFEYKLLNYAPEPWTVLKSGLLYKYMADMLNSFERDMENTNFLQLYGREMLDLVYPDVDNYEDPVIEANGDWGFDGLKKSLSATEVPADQLVRLEKLPQPDPNNGSNNWAVSAKKSASGHALLCNDMHLRLYMPSLWYYIQQQSTGVNVYGHSLPGIPIVITGFTDSIAWGFTNAQRDLVDWYKITYENDSRERYLLDGAYVPVNKRIEEIKIRGKESYYDTVAYTVFGPVTYDNSFKAAAQKNGYAYRWIDHDPQQGINMFYLMNRAQNFQDYMNALDHFATPAQNVVFASVQGDIAHKVQGKYPMNGVEEGKFIKNGSSVSNNWQDFIPAAHNAFWKNPDRGFVSSANQHPTDSTYPYYITGKSFEAYRNRRINDVLRADSTITIDDMKALQYDSYSMKAAESLPIMLELLNGHSLSAEEIALTETMGQWDYYFTPESETATMFDIWYETIYTEVWDEISNSGKENIPLAYPTDYSTINLLKTHPENTFFDHKSTAQVESAGDIVLMSFREMIQKIKDVKAGKGSNRWADVKSTYVEHQLRIKPLGFYGISTSGNGGDVVNATGRNHGPSERIIVELDPAGVKAWGHYPGGQSGNPASKFYDNMVMPWANGEYFDLLFLSSPDAGGKRILYTQKINK